MLSAMVKSVKIPVTIKIRTGWDSNSRNASEVVKVAAGAGISWVAIHGRTRAQGYAGLSDWDFISEVKNSASIPILGNGDILTAEQAVSRMKSTGVDGVLIGRGALKNPFIFMDAMALWSGRGIDKSLNRDYRAVFLSLKNCIALHCEERILQIQLKKFAAWFATGYPGASQFRKSIFQGLTTEEITQLALDYFSTINQSHQADTSSEAFLMGGHG
jgi:tRNA-dihydrouridine synthase B